MRSVRPTLDRRSELDSVISRHLRRSLASRWQGLQRNPHHVQDLPFPFRLQQVKIIREIALGDFVPAPARVASTMVYLLATLRTSLPVGRGMGPASPGRGEQPVPFSPQHSIESPRYLRKLLRELAGTRPSQQDMALKSARPARVPPWLPCERRGSFRRCYGSAPSDRAYRSHP